MDLIDEDSAAEPWPNERGMAGADRASEAQRQPRHRKPTIQLSSSGLWLEPQREDVIANIGWPVPANDPGEDWLAKPQMRHFANTNYSYLYQQCQVEGKSAHALAARRQGMPGGVAFPCRQALAAASRRSAQPLSPHSDGSHCRFQVQRHASSDGTWASPAPWARRGRLAFFTLYCKYELFSFIMQALSTNQAWSSIMIVCVCNRVSDREIARHVRSGMSFDDIQLELGVATQCGRCESCARQVVEQCGVAHPVAAVSSREAVVTWASPSPRLAAA